MILTLVQSTGNSIDEAIKISEFDPQELVLLGGGTTKYPVKIINLPEPGPARTAIYVMQLRKSPSVIIIWEGKDRELIDLALSLCLPLYVHYINGYEVGVRFNYEEEDF